MKLFTVKAGDVKQAVLVETFTLKNGTQIPAVLIGESGRGRQLGVLPVKLLSHSYKEWAEKGAVWIQAARVGTTKKGSPKLFEESLADENSDAIVVLRTGMGYRGSNNHTGDRTGEFIEEPGGRKRPEFYPFPGEILSEGVIAQGTAGRMGSGRQLVAKFSPEVVFRTGYKGRLYGGPQSHYYYYDGTTILAATWDEREVSDIF